MVHTQVVVTKSADSVSGTILNKETVLLSTVKTSDSEFTELLPPAS